MLKTSQNRKPKVVSVDEQIWRDLIQGTLDGINMRIVVLKKMISHQLDEYICAALYTFVLEEFGKLTLLAQYPKVKGNKREIKYANEFTNHETKFAAALDYLQANGFEEAYVLNNYGDFSTKDFSWESFEIGQLVDLETRLSLLYSDLEEDKKSGNIVISKAPFIDKDFLETAVDTFTKAINAYNLPS